MTYIPAPALADALDQEDVIRIDRSGGTFFMRVAEFAADPLMASSGGFVFVNAGDSLPPGLPVDSVVIVRA